MAKENGIIKRKMCPSMDEAIIIRDVFTKELDTL